MSNSTNPIKKVTKNDLSKIKVEYHGELMNNYFAETSIEDGKGLKVIKINDDDCMIFYVDTHNVLNAILSYHGDVQTHDNGAGEHSGWKQIVLSQQNIKVDAFDVFFNNTSKKIKIGYSGRNSSSTTSLSLSDEIDTTNINTLATLNSHVQWSSVHIDTATSSRTINHITLYATKGLFSTKFGSTDATFYKFDYGQTPTEYVLPNNATTIQQLEIGQFWGVSGAFMLYSDSQSNAMKFIPFDSESHPIANFTLSSAAGEVKCFSLLQGDDNNCDLYLGAKGIYSFHSITNPKTIVPNTAGKSYKKINVSALSTSGGKKEISIWALSDTGELDFVSNRHYTSATQIDYSKWNSPIPMHTSVDDFESIKGSNLINQLFLFGDIGDGTKSLIHFWQDSVSTIWEEHTVNLTSLSHSYKKKTFTMTVDFFCDEALKHFYNEKVKISAESNLLVYINNKKYHIGPSKEVEVALEGNHLHFVYTTSTISAAKIFINGLNLAISETSTTTSYCAKKFTIDSGGVFRNRLNSKVKQGTNLRTLKKQDNTPLIGSSVHTTNQKLSDIANMTSQLSNHVSAIDLGQENIQMNTSLSYECSGMFGTENLGSIWSVIGHAIGSVIHAIKKGLVQATKFIVQGANLLIHFGEKVFSWAKTAVRAVFHFIEGVWHDIKVGVEDFIKFIGFLFSWEDILHTKDALKEYTLALFTNIETNVGRAKTKVVQILEQLKTNLTGLSGSVPTQGLNQQNYQSADSKVKKNGKTDPRANWVHSKKHHFKKAQVAIPSQPVPASTQTNMGKLLPHLNTLESKLSTDFSNILSDFQKFMKGNLTFGKLIENCLHNLEAAVIDILIEVVKILFDMVEDALDFLKNFFTQSLKIPFFSALYKTIAQSDLTLLDFICLIIAVPATVLYKIGENGAVPFSANGQNKTAFVNSARQFFN